MRAARIVEPRRVEVEDVAIPDPEPNQVRFRVMGCGVCASNLGPWLGHPWMQYPLGAGECGHEAWGVVDAVGKNVRGIEPGVSVAAVSYNSFAEYDLAHPDALVQLPGQLRGLPFPGEALGCAMNIFERSRIQAGNVVAILGIGFLGSLLTRLAKLQDATVIAVSRRPSSLSLAARMGADELVPMDDHTRVIEHVRELTHGRFCDRVIEATGKQWPLDLAGELTATRGVLSIAGYHQDGPRQINMQLWNFRGLDVVNAHERDTARYVRGIRAALDAMLSQRLDASPLVTHRFSLQELGEALDVTAQRPEGFVKAVVIP